MATIRRFSVLLVFLLLGVGCTNGGDGETVVAGDPSAEQPADDPSGASSLPPTFELLRGTSWQIIEIDGEPTLPDGIGLALYMTDEGLKGSVTDRCGGSGEFFLNPDFTVARTQILGALCHPQWGSTFRSGPPVSFEISDRLTITNGEHVLVGRHFESVPQVGPVARGARADCENPISELPSIDTAPSASVAYSNVEDLRAAIQAGSFGPLEWSIGDVELADTRGIAGESTVRAWYPDERGTIGLVITMIQDRSGDWILGSWSSCLPVEDH